MREFLRVVGLDEALAHVERFDQVGPESVPLGEAVGRTLAVDVVAPADLPGFRRSTMDGFAVVAASTFGASEAAPALLDLIGAVGMGEVPTTVVGRGQAIGLPTGGMLPPGADAVVMVEQTEALDESTIEVSHAAAPGQNVIEPAEDAAQGEVLLRSGAALRPQEVGLLAALGRATVPVFRRPVVSILSTGDEIVPVEADPRPGQVRDVNSHSLAALVASSGGVPRPLGIVADRLDELLEAARGALESSDMLLISGGSSVGTRDLTVDVLQALPDSELLVHGVAIRPGKPTLLARVGGKAVWGLPGHVASAMVVFHALVKPVLHRVAGRTIDRRPPAQVRARLSRNLSSVHGRVDFVRVRLDGSADQRVAVPILGRSGLVRTMVEADGLLRVERNTEGLEARTEVSVLLL